MSQKGRSGCCWSACLLPLLLLLLLPPAIGVPCFLRYLHRAAGTYREANLDLDAAPDIIARRKNHGGTRNGPALVVCSLSACLLLLAATTAARLLRPLSQAFSDRQSLWRDVWASVLLKSSSDWALRSLFWMGPRKQARGTRQQQEKAIPHSSPCQNY